MADAHAIGSSIGLFVVDGVSQFVKIEALEIVVVEHSNYTQIEWILKIGLLRGKFQSSKLGGVYSTLKLIIVLNFDWFYSGNTT